MIYKVLILDLDGTTVAPTAQSLPSSEVINAIKKAKKIIKVSVATGRPYNFSEHIIKALEIDQPCVFNGGSEIIDVKNNEFLFKSYLSIKTQREIVKICLPFNYAILNGNEDKKRINTPDDIKEERGKVILIGVKNSVAIKILEELTAVEDIEAYPTLSWEKGNVSDIHITHKNATKKHGIEFLLKYLGVDKEEAIGVGDGHNDLPLFFSVGLKIAMGNAPKELKDFADYIAPSIEDDGVADVINKFILQ